MTKFQFDGAQEAEASRAFLVTVTLGRDAPFDAGQELTDLVTSDAMVPVGLLQARRDRPDAATYLGSGKIEEIKTLAQAAGADVIVFDAALSAAQERNVAQMTELAVMDRTELILEIFRRRAKSKEGRLQVELAHLEHLSTRLVRGWTHLERQRGGLSKTGGPGEKQIELDRRMIGTRVKALREQLKKLQRQRDTQRRARNKADRMTVSLVGYTNAGKSSLFNRLTRAQSYAADQLFATLDTTARRCWISEDETVVASDTVGFIRGLPHQLVQAFKSTLDETVHADVLLHVVDSNSPVREEQMASVLEVLREIEAAQVPIITVFNKTDLSGRPVAVQRDASGAVRSVSLSAQTGEGMDLLRQALVETAVRWRTALHGETASQDEPLPAYDDPADPVESDAPADDPLTDAAGNRIEGPKC